MLYLCTYGHVLHCFELPGVKMGKIAGSLSDPLSLNVTRLWKVYLNNSGLSQI